MHIAIRFLQANTMGEIVRVMHFGTVDMSIHADMGIGIGGDKWPAAELFCEVISDPRWKDYFRKFFEGKRVVELGAGTGLCGMLIDLMFQPKEVVITDQQSHVDLIARNIALNHCMSCSASVLDWCNLGDISVKYDVVLGLEW